MADVPEPEECGVCSAQSPALVVGGGAQGEARLLGTGLAVWEVIAAAEREPHRTELARALGLTAHQVRVAFAYEERHPEEIERARALSRS